MEVYQIKNLISGKVYIGSTIYTAEDRCYNSKSGHFPLAKRGVDYPLYQDIRLFGEDNFELTVLEVVDGNESDLRHREDFWIKSCNSEMYNKIDSANPWWSTDEQKRMMDIRKSKYGDAAFNLHNPEVHAKSTETYKLRHGTCTKHLQSAKTREKQRKSQSRKIIYNGKLFYGAGELCNYLNSELGIQISVSSVKRLVNGSYISKFPELVGQFLIID